jgi:prophage regulatory protein
MFAGEINMAQNSKRFLRLHEVRHQVGLGRSAIYLKIKTGDFPSPYPLGIRAVGWLSTDVDAWIDSRITATTAA